MKVLSNDWSNLYGLGKGRLGCLQKNVEIKPGGKTWVAKEIEEVHALAPPLLVSDHSLLFQVAEEHGAAWKRPHNEPPVRCFRHHYFVFLRYMAIWCHGIAGHHGGHFIAEGA